MRDLATFTSSKFTPVLPDECQVNPGVFGAELAYWLSLALARRGVITSYPEHEDWGWFIEYSTDTGSEFAVHCGNVQGSREQWLLSLRGHGRKLFGRDKPPYGDAAPLIAAIRLVLETEPEISDLRWISSEAA